MKTEIVGVSTLGGSISYKTAEAGLQRRVKGNSVFRLGVDLAVRFAIELCGRLS